jgi:hypothetical protein
VTTVQHAVVENSVIASSVPMIVQHAMIAHASTVTTAQHAIVTTVQHAVVETSADAMTVQHVVAMTAQHAIVTTVQHVVVGTSAAVTTVQHVVAMTVQHADLVQKTAAHAPVHAEKQTALAKSQHAVTRTQV